MQECGHKVLSIVWLGLAWFHGNYPLFTGWIAELVYLGLSAVVGAFVFVGAAYLLKANEVDLLVGQAKAIADKWKARRSPGT